MRWIFAAVILAFPLASFGNSTGGQGASDCSLAVRRDATTYVEMGFSDRAATTVGQADESECDDMGADPQGAFFPKQPEQVDVWSFDGQDTREVLGVKLPDGTLRIFIAEDVPKAEAAAISDALEQSSLG